MTGEERQMMNTIHMYGLMLSMDGASKSALLDHIKAILKEEQSGDQV